MSLERATHSSIFFLILISFNERITVLQYCLGFCHMARWISHRNTYLPPLLNLPPRAAFLAWRIPRTEGPGRLQSTGSQRGGHDWATKQGVCSGSLSLVSDFCDVCLCLFYCFYWRTASLQCCLFPVYGQVNQPYAYLCPLLCGFFFPFSSLC